MVPVMMGRRVDGLRLVCPKLPSTRESRSVIVCHCEVVRCQDVRRAVDHGARTVAAVCASTGAARNCGGCVFAVKRVMCEHVDSQTAGLTEAHGAAS